MSNSSQKAWSDDPYAPQISYPIYLAEKTSFAGELIGTVLYGMQMYTAAHPFSPDRYIYSTF